MFEDILGFTDERLPELLDIYHGCPFCGARNIEEDGPGSFPTEDQLIQPMVCSSCDGTFTVEYDKDLAVKNVNRKV